MSSITRFGNLTLKLPEGVEVSNSTENGEVISLFDENGRVVIPEYVQVGLGYKTDKGKFKVTHSLRSDNKTISTNLSVLLSKYDVLYAIDTNKKKIDDIEYCISSRMLMQMELTGEQLWEMKLIRLPAFIFTTPIEHEEKIGWSQFIEQEHLALNGKKIGIVTDHDLGHMPLYNQREKAILDLGLLPENIDFIYASADRDKGSPLNKAVMQCDADSNLLLKQIYNKKMNLSALANSESAFFDQSGSLVPRAKCN
ncbi:hypothetical protein [Colwellia sp. UCD-KL20]|uniref:hypothetical protein n=1 Tax=Colwellia sp. UCD-KL20 TaxID=1917165 RepID=UPI000970A99C|nr:hypothetical protein [Colwellia sp. UCD-KL20]